MNALDEPLDRASFVTVDVETTGLDPARDDIVEIGAVKVMGGRVIDEFTTLVYIDRQVPAMARQIHGIGNEMLEGSPYIRDALMLFLRFSESGILAEHSHKCFDISFLEHAHGSHLGPAVNTCTLSRILFPHFHSHSLDACCKRYRISNAQHHRALSDAHATADLLLYLLRLGKTRYPRLSDLLQVCAVER